MRLKRQRATPKEVVLSAYNAARLGRFAEANALVAPEVRKGLANAHSEIVAADRLLRRSLLRLKGRRGEFAARHRKTLSVAIRLNQEVIQMQMQSSGFLNVLWKAFTQERPVLRVETTRQVIRGSQAKVYLRLTLRDGSIVRDSESLVLHRGRWFLG